MHTEVSQHARKKQSVYLKEKTLTFHVTSFDNQAQRLTRQKYAYSEFMQTQTKTK